MSRDELAVASMEALAIMWGGLPDAHVHLAAFLGQYSPAEAAAVGAAATVGCPDADRERLARLFVSAGTR